MTIYEAKELNALINFQLSKEDEATCEQLESDLMHYRAFESFISDASSPVIEGALESLKSIISKIREAFHKLVVRFGLIVRSITIRGKATKLAKNLASLGNTGLLVRSPDMEAMRSAFEKCGIENSWTDGVQAEGILAMRYTVTPAAVRSNVKKLLSTAVSIDRDLEGWLEKPSADVDTNDLRKKAKLCSNAINLTIKFLNGFVIGKAQAEANAKKANANGK